MVFAVSPGVFRQAQRCAWQVRFCVLILPCRLKLIHGLVQGQVIASEMVMAESDFNINVEDIREEGLHLAFDDMAAARGFDADLPEDMDLSGPLYGQADFFRDGRNIHLSGKIRGVLLLRCHRCLGQCSQAIEKDFYYLLQAAEDDDSAELREVSLGADDLDVWNFQHGVIRLAQIFREQLLLQVPLKVLCSTECKGLCPGCGRDLNTEECCCEAVDDSSPFAVLKGLKVSGR